MNISKEIALFFMDQCIGEYPGHMAMIPNNPTLKSLVNCSVGGNVITVHEFAEFCQAVSSALKGESTNDDA